MDEVKTDGMLETETLQETKESQTLAADESNSLESLQESETAQEPEEIRMLDTEEPISDMEEAVVEVAEKPKSGGLKVAAIVLVVALIALVGVYAVSAIQSNKLIKEAIALAQDEDYEGATAMVDELSGNAYRKALKKLQVVFDEKLDEYIEDEEYLDAYTLIQAAQWHPDYEDLVEDNYEVLSEAIAALMDEGDYVAAAKMLKKVPTHPDYDDIREMITAESWIWTCVNNLKPVMKNPRSLQINSAEIYRPSDEGAQYPSIVLCESGQNGYGGYSTSYTVYDDEDLSLLGITSSISDPDDLSEQITVIIIKRYREETEIEYEYDLNRINKLLSDGVTVKPDLQKYELGGSKNT